MDVRSNVILDMKTLRTAPFNKMRWEISSSGVLVKSSVAESLEESWRMETGKNVAVEPELEPATDTGNLAEEDSDTGGEATQTPATDDAQIDDMQEEKSLKSTSIGTSDEQVDPMYYAIVTAYFDQLFKSVTGQIFRRRDVLAGYADQLDKLEKGKLDRYFCQVSALLAELGLPFMTENHPWAGASHDLQNALSNYLAENIEKLRNFRRVALHSKEDPPKEITDSRLFWIAPPDPSSYRYSGVPEKLQNLPDALDFLIAETIDHKLHARAIDFVLAYEKARLRESGQSQLAEKIEKIDSRDRETGCDIISFDEDGEARSILVKPTHFGKHFPFIIFNDEIEDLRRGEAEHYIYRPFNLAFEYKLFVLKEGLSEMEHTGFDSQEHAVRLITYDRIIFGWPKLIEDKILGTRFGFVYRT